MDKPVVSILSNTLDGGGTERVISNLLNELGSMYDLILVLLKNRIEYKIPEGVKVRLISKSKKIDGALKNFASLPMLASRYKKICTEEKVNVSISFLTRPNYINVLAKSYGSKMETIISERCYPSIAYASNKWRFKLYKKLIPNLYNKSDYITANSNAIAWDLKNNFGVDKEVQTIYNPLNIEKINALLAESHTVSKNKEFTFISVGSLSKPKNHLLLLEAFSAFKSKDVKLWIVGKGPLLRVLQDRITELGLEESVELLGFQMNPYKYLANADCFVLSSETEGFPNVLVEAMGVGLPVISTDCLSGPREILAPKSNFLDVLTEKFVLEEFGILTPSKNAKMLTQAMQLVLEDDELRKIYRVKSKNRAQDFNLEATVLKFKSLIQEAHV